MPEGKELEFRVKALSIGQSEGKEVIFASSRTGKMYKIDYDSEEAPEPIVENIDGEAVKSIAGTTVNVAYGLLSIELFNDKGERKAFDVPQRMFDVDNHNEQLRLLVGNGENTLTLTGFKNSNDVFGSEGELIGQNSSVRLDNALRIGLNDKYVLVYRGDSSIELYDAGKKDLPFVKKFTLEGNPDFGNNIFWREA